MPDLVPSPLAGQLAALERQLSQAILRLDDDAVVRLAQAALQIGFTRDEMLAVFGPTISRTLETLYDELARLTAQESGLPAAYAETGQEGLIAADRLTAELASKADPVAAAMVTRARLEGWGVGRLAQELRAGIGLTEAQIGYVANFERKLREDPLAVLRENSLRDRRFDRTLRSGRALNESEIDRMVGFYRARWLKYRADGIAQLELQRASNAARSATFENAQKRGLLPAYARKFWIHMHDAKVRESHLEIPLLNPDGVPVDGTFVTPLGTLRYPLDPAGAPEDVIGCRCSLVFNVPAPVGAT